MKTITKQLVLPFLAFALLGANGCATYENLSPAPKQTQAINIVVDQNELSGGSDLPIGALHVDDAPLIISGHQSNNSGAMMFGLIGALIADQMGESEAEERIKLVKERLKLGMDGFFYEAVADGITRPEFKGKFIQADNTTAGPTLRVTPVLLLSYVDETNVKAFVELKLGLYDNDKNRVWSSRYFSSNGKALPLAGDVSWTANNNAVIRESVKTSLRQLVHVMLSDMSHAYVRDENQMYMVQDYFPYVKQKVEVMGYKLAEEEDYIVFAPKLGDVMVFSGINLIKKDIASPRVAKQDQPVFRIIQP